MKINYNELMKLAPRFFIQASNIHSGGGAILLIQLLKAIDFETILLVDSRCTLPNNISEKIVVRRLPPTIFSRIFAELWLFAFSRKNDTIFCFGNLPPLCRSSSNVHVFIQNWYLLDNVKVKYKPLNVKIRLLIEKLWLRARVLNVNSFIVQNSSLFHHLNKLVSNRVPIRIFPFIDSDSLIPIENTFIGPKPYDYAYIASGDAHKNHRRLLEAWRILAEQGHYPTLLLTISKTSYPKLFELISEYNLKYNLKIINFGELSHSEVIKIYTQVKAAIFPSEFESFGIPLVEASLSSLPILASELDYVRDIVSPVQTFNPQSPLSIARAVQRHLGEDSVNIKIVSPAEFIHSIFKPGEA